MISSLLTTLNDYVQTFRGINPSTIPDDFAPGTDLRGKWVIITGGNSGIGFEAAKFFATWGANIILACRDPPTYEQHPIDAVKTCREVSKEQGHSSTVEWWQIDMSCLSSVEAFCQRWLETNHTLDILCNNAGEPSGDPIRMTDDGFQYTHQIKLLAPVLTTLRLLPSIAKSPEPRIICTVSAAHHMGQLDFEHFNGGPGLGTLAYSNNKLFFQMWIVEMQSRFFKHPEYLHITIHGVNPGMVLSSIWNTASNKDRPITKFLLQHCGITSKQGSFPIIHAATSPSAWTGSQEAECRFTSRMRWREVYQSSMGGPC
ncbi:NAD(P)-binding protein [Penicillium malachiteum]|uniref:NAD(P)-binding protein n=1 Tax=Penicillium malachiteum TaxID=1324776 RepID=A0AAD6HNX7_9EURO|nr:NAD(P)-binding protein [Penicillium malachiteum]